MHRMLVNVWKNMFHEQHKTTSYCTRAMISKKNLDVNAPSFLTMFTNKKYILSL